MHEAVVLFGETRGIPKLAEVVWDLYEAALQPSSRRTYGTGQRAYTRFVNSMTNGDHLPFQRRILGDTELNLAFFMAFLLLEPKITKATTILGYESHVKYEFREEGCKKGEYDTLFLKQIRRGLRNTLPSFPDSRHPLLLPSVVSTVSFQQPRSKSERILRFATILGFIGMMRPKVLEQLCPSSFTMITTTGGTIDMPESSRQFQEVLNRLRCQDIILGFFTSFRSKTMPCARAYFPSLCIMDVQLPMSTMCPVRALVDMSRRGLLKKRFLRSLNGGRKLTKYLQTLVGVRDNIAPYALRIGGRTWLLTKGMDRQFVDFLGRWKSPEASARYFRAAPREAIIMLRQFYFEKGMKL